MNIAALVAGVETIEIIGSTDTEIKELQLDSRKIKDGALFAALTGTQVNGHKFIESAVENGAKCVLCEILPKVLKPDVTYVRVQNSSIAIGQIAHEFFGRPSEELRVIGVTGTNGKTTVATLTYQLFLNLGEKCGLISTISYRIGATTYDSSHTTPDAIRIHQLFREMVDQNCTRAVMEVSSHAADQNRIAGIEFAGAIFTNLSHDHLDYHGTFKAYIQAKKKFFDGLSSQAFALVNDDDPNGVIMVQNTSAKVSKFSLRKVSDFKARILENSIQGLHLELNGIPIHSRLVGKFNAYNLCAVFGAASLSGVDDQELLTELSNLKSAEGRFELIKGQRKDVYGIVDYAHTPDALEKVLETIQQLRRPEQRVIAIVGCGGDRDKLKRPKMARVAAHYSDITILTSDNPRSENPEDILTDMEAGIDEERKSNVLTISDRKQAIKTAIMMAQTGDLILVAGKGHEKYQEIKGVKYPFDDIAILKEELAEKHTN